MEPRNPWAVLGLPEDADLGEARRAFRRLAKRTHPDAGGDGRAFAEAADAIQALRATLPAPPRARLATPYDWVTALPPEPPPDPALYPRRSPTPAPIPDFDAILAAEVAKIAA